MPDFKKLDEARRLCPWSSQHDADYVAGQYGSLLQEPATAEAYVQSYERKEKEFDEAYKLQRRLLTEASKRANDEPQELPDLVKIDWNPRKRFASKPAATKAAKKTERAPKKSKTA